MHPEASRNATPAENKRALLDSAYEGPHQPHRQLEAKNSEMGFKDLMGTSMFTMRKSWGSLGSSMAPPSKEAGGGGPVSLVKDLSSTAKHGGGGEIEVVVTTHDAAAALKAQKVAASKGDTASVRHKPAFALSWQDQQSRLTREGLGESVSRPAVALDPDGEEDDRWLGDGVFSIDMHHRCRPFTARVEPLELMVQLDLVPQPAPAVGEDMSTASSGSPQGAKASLEDVPPGFQNKQYNVWSNAAHGYQQAPAGTPEKLALAPEMQGVLVMQGHK